MKKICTLLGLQALLLNAAQAQQIKDKIEEAHRNPQTAERAALADVLLVHQHRWVEGRSTLPAISPIMAAPARKSGKSTTQ